MLVNYFLKRFSRESASPVRRVTRRALEVLTNYNWPGNVRELRNIIHRAVVLGNKPVLDAEDLPADLDNARPLARPAGVEVGRSIDEVERELILKTLESTGWNKTQAARILQVTPRTLRNKLGRYRQEGLLDGQPARA